MKLYEYLIGGKRKSTSGFNPDNEVTFRQVNVGSVLYLMGWGDTLGNLSTYEELKYEGNRINTAKVTIFLRKNRVDWCKKEIPLDDFDYSITVWEDTKNHRKFALTTFKANPDDVHKFVLEMSKYSIPSFDGLDRRGMMR